MSKDAVILLPSYQPEETLVVLSKALYDLGFPVLIVDDGSGEKFKDIFDRCKSWSKVISYEKNKGKGGALKTGYQDCLESFPDCKYVITADGDGQHRIQDIVRVYERISKVNMSVIGIRKFDVKVPIKSKLGNGLSKFTQSLSTYRYMHDNQCGLRAFTYKDLPTMIKIKGNRYEYEMNVLSYIQLHEMPFQCINIQTIYEEGNKTSHFRALWDTLRIQGSLLLSGLVNVLCFLFQAILSSILSVTVLANNNFGIELSILIGFSAALVLHVLLKAIIYKPKYVGKMLVRVILYQFLQLIAIIISVTLFTRVARLPIGVSYLFDFLLTLLPLFYIVKGVGIVYDSQING